MNAIEKMTQADAVMACAMLSAMADGKLRESEIARLRLIVFESPLFDSVQNADEYILSVAEYVAEKNPDAVIEEAKSVLSPALRETAFAWAAQMVYADKKVVRPEHAYLRALKGKLEINGELAGKILAVASMFFRSK